MLRIAAQLLTCSTAFTLSDLPAFDHADPGPGFARIETILRELMEIVIASRYVRLRLDEAKPGFFTGSLTDMTLPGKAAYYIGISADLPPGEIVETVPQRFKVGSVEDVEQMVLTAMPGLQLMPAVQLPPAIPVRPGCYYFSIEPHGPLYTRMILSGAVCIYVPGGFDQLRLELFAIAQ
jgi:type VI secretion system protein ImpJ